MHSLRKSKHRNTERLFELAQAKGAYDFSDILRANDVDDLIYYVTLRDLQHGDQNFQKNNVIFIS